MNLFYYEFTLSFTEFPTVYILIDWYFYIEDEKGEEVYLNTYTLGKLFEQIGWKVEWKWKQKKISIPTIAEWLGVSVEDIIAIAFVKQNGKDVAVIFLHDNIVIAVGKDKLPRVEMNLPFVKAKLFFSMSEPYTKKTLFDFLEEKDFFDIDGYVFTEEKLRNLFEEAKKRSGKMKDERKKYENFIRNFEKFLKVEKRKFVYIDY